jgi:hypothetical protein
MPTRSPDILGLITNRIDHLETNLTSQMHDIRTDLGERISELAIKVNCQNGRVNEMEKQIVKLDANIQTDLAKPAMDKRKIALVGTGGIVSGAALIEALSWIIGK